MSKEDNKSKALTTIYKLAQQRYDEHVASTASSSERKQACTDEELSMNTTPPITTKRCSRGDKCVHPQGPVLPATKEYFHRDKKRKDGLFAQCKACQNQQVAEYSREHIEKIRKNARKRQKDYKQRHPDADRIGRHRRQARKRGTVPTFTLRDWQFACEYWNGACAYCNAGPSMFDRLWILHQEHYIPLSQGGTYTPDNILPACQSCNCSKNNVEPHKWLVFRFGARKAKQIEARIATYFESVRRRTDVTAPDLNLPLFAFEDLPFPESGFDMSTALDLENYQIKKIDTNWFDGTDPIQPYMLASNGYISDVQYRSAA